MIAALAWALGITAAEEAARRSERSRARAWLIAYAAVGAVALSRSAPPRRRSRMPLALGVLTACAGYDLGRRVLPQPAPAPPQDPARDELVALGAVALAEELAWGRHVEAHAGAVVTGVLFALKHAAIDRQASRSVGLALFSWGLSSVRGRSPVAAALLHCGLNAAGVWRGHRARRDEFGALIR